MTIYASDQSLLTFSLEYETPEPEQLDSRGRIVREAVAAMFAFAGDWLAPSAVGFRIASLDPNNFFEESGAPVARVLLGESDTPPDVVVNPAVAESDEVILPQIRASDVELALQAAVIKPASPGCMAGLDEMSWTAVKARSPSRDPMQLAVGAHLMTPPARVEGEALWYFGPSGIAGPPVRLRILGTHWIVTLQIDVFWELWISEPAGRALVDAGLERVRARGWR